MTQFLKLGKIVLGVAVDILLLWTLGNEIKDRKNALKKQYVATEESDSESDE